MALVRYLLFYITFHRAYKTKNSLDDFKVMA